MLSTLFLLAQLPARPLTLDGGFDLEAKPVVVKPTASKGTILFFIAVDCPIANRYAPEIGRISRAYMKKGIVAYRVYVLDKSRTKEVARHGREFDLKMPAILDPSRKLVAETGVKVTPEAVLINSKGRMVYRGRIDDQNIEHGKTRTGYRRDLRIALDEYLAGKPVSIPTAAAVGCFL